MRPLAAAPSRSSASVPSAADGVRVPVELAPLVARILLDAARAAALAERDGHRAGVPIGALLDLARKLAVTGPGHEIGHRPRLLSTLDAAARLDVSEATIRRWCRSGRLPTQRAGHSWLVEEWAVIAWQAR